MTTGEPALIILLGPTASGKSALALRLGKAYGGEIVSCDSVAVYRGLDVGSAKPSSSERARVPHHGLDILNPDQPSTAGDYARMAREAFQQIRQRGKLPILSGGTGLYLRATLDGLAPAPPRDEVLRDRLRTHAARRGSGALHRILRRFDPRAGERIHPHDTPKLIRSLEMTLRGDQPQTEQWAAGREPLRGFRVLQIGLDPPRSALYESINVRAAAMFSSGLLEETAAAASTYGEDARALGSLGYAQALAVLRGSLPIADAIAAAQQGHRNYAKRQLTWFRRDHRIHWIGGFGSDPAVQSEALGIVGEHLISGTSERESRGA